MFIAQLKRYSPLRVVLMSVLFVGLVPFPRIVLEQWVVRVVNEHDVPVPGVRVSCTLDDYTYGLEVGWDFYTNSEGKVIFPRTTFFRPSIYWIGKAIWNIMNLLSHASFGVTGRVWISDEQAAEHPSVLCSRGGCTARRMESELRFIRD
jgi:hypothetical protein